MRLSVLAFGLTLALIVCASVAPPLSRGLTLAQHRLSCYGIAPNGNDFLPHAECVERAR